MVSSYFFKTKIINGFYKMRFRYLRILAFTVKMLSLRGLSRQLVCSTPRTTRLMSIAVMAPKFEVSSSSNGVRVASETLPGETCTVGVWIDAGSRYLLATQRK